jgi:hypothetical protein
MKLKANVSYLGVVLTLILIALIYLVFVFFSPFNLIKQAQERGIVEKAAKAAGVKIAEFQFMAELGKTDGFTDLTELKKLSKFNEEVYKDAKKGDRAIAFGNKMVIERNGKLIYDGPSPLQKQQADQLEKVKAGDAKVKAANIVSGNEQPQVAVVQNIEQLKGAEFYAKAKNADLVLAYNNAGVVVLISDETGEILNNAKAQAPAAAASATPVKK